MPFREGDCVIISSSKTPGASRFNGKKANITRKSPILASDCNGKIIDKYSYFVKILDECVSLVVDEDELIPARTNEQIYLDNLYRRYMRIRIEAMCDALKIMAEEKDIDRAMERISNYIHKNNRKAFDNPVGSIAALLNRDVSLVT